MTNLTFSYGVIQAKKSNQRLAGKHMQDVGGAPLIVRVIEGVIESGAYDHVVVSSDDDEILEIAAWLNVDFVQRPAELCVDPVVYDGGAFIAKLNAFHVEHLHTRLEYDWLMARRLIMNRIMGNTLIFDTSIHRRVVEMGAANVGWRNVHCVSPVDPEHHPASMVELAGDHVKFISGGFASHAVPSELRDPLYVLSGGPGAVAVPDEPDGYMMGAVIDRTQLVHVHTAEDMELARALWEYRHKPKNESPMDFSLSPNES